MVRFDSINTTISGRPHPEDRLATYLQDLAVAWGLNVQRLPVGDEGSFDLLVWCGGSSQSASAADAQWLLLESHLDTVGVEGMTIPPFEAHIRGSRLYGRGACDTKGSGAAMLWALHLHAKNPTRSNNVALLFTVDEEAHKTGIEAFVHEHLPCLGWRPWGAVVGEPTELKLVVAHCGVVRWSIRTHGLAAHSSDPRRGRSAIRMMTQVIDALESQYIAKLAANHPLTGPAQCSINMIRGGTAVNIIPDCCEIWLDRRVVPGEDPARVLPQVEQTLEGLRAEVPDLSYSMSKPFSTLPLDPAGGSVFFAVAQRVLRHLGLGSELCGVGYGSDASDLSAAGIPVVLLGPGDIAQAHSEAEYLELDQLELAVEAYLGLMRAPMEASP